jgi:hypothetical protein
MGSKQREFVAQKTASVAYKMFREKMYKARLRAWGLRKHNRRREVERILKIKNERDRLGKQTAFLLGGREVDLDDIGRYRKRHQVQIHNSDTDEFTSEEVLDLAWFTPPASPSPQSFSPAVTPSSSLGTSSPHSVPRAVALPATLGHREDYMRGVAVGFELMIKTGFWNLSTQLEMPWVPVLVHAISEPVVSDSYHQDECFRYLTNGVTYIQKGDVFTAYKEWNAAFSLVSTLVRSKHYNVLGKLLECIQYLDQKEHRAVSEAFRRYVCKMAQTLLGPYHPYYPVFCAFEHLPLEDVSELQMNTQQCLVRGLESFLGPQAFTSFEHKMVLAQRRLEADPDRQIDELMPTDAECSIIHGPTSSKTFLVLNLRYCVLRSRGLLKEAQEVCLMIINKAMLVDDAPLRLWHLTSAWVSLGRVQYDLSEFHPMRSSLRYALAAEEELRNKYGMVKLGEGELHWICEKLGVEPQFREMEPVEMDIEDSSSS